MSDYPKEYFSDDGLGFVGDALRLQRVIAEKRHTWLEVPDAVRFWRWRSQLWSAGWLDFRDDDDVVEHFDQWIAAGQPEDL